MTEYRTEEDVRRYDIFKGSVAGLLLLLLMILAASDYGAGSEPTASVPQELPATGGVADAEVPPEADLAPPPSLALAPPDLLSPAPGAELNAGPVTFSGMGVPGSQVAVVADGQELGRTTVDSNGTWQLDAELPSGDVELELQALDTSGNVAASSSAIPMTIVDAGAGLEPLTVDPLPLDATAGPITVSGTGEPGYQAAVDVNGVETATAVIDDSGNWSVDVRVPEGAVAVSVRMVAADGSAVRTAEAGQMDVAAATPPTVNLPPTDLRAGTVTLDGSGQPGTILRLLANGEDIGTTTIAEDGTWSVETTLPAGDYEIDIVTLDEENNVTALIPAISLPVLEPEPPVVEAPDQAQPDFNPLSGARAWQGQSDPGSRVAAVVDDEVVAETTTGEDGTWQLDLGLEPGEYDLSFARLDVEGNVVAQSEPTAVTVDSAAPRVNLPDFSLPDDFSGVELPELQLPAGAQEWSGTSDPGSEVAVVVDGEVTATATADDEGGFTLPFELPAGASTIQLALLDADGALIAQSKALAAAVVEAVVPTLQVPEEIAPDDTAVTVSGTAEPNTRVQITADGEPLGQALVDALGNWTFELQRLAEDVVLRVQALDEAENVVLSSSPAEVAGTGEVVAEETAVLSGTVTYADGDPLPDDALITVQLQDISVADAPVTVLGEQVIEGAGQQVPIPYEITYNPDEIQDDLTYSVSVRITNSDGDLLFYSDTMTPVLTGDNPADGVEIVAVPVVRDEEQVVEEVPEVGLGTEADSVVDATVDSGSFTTLVKGLEAAGLTGSLSEVEGEYTLFAPIDAAFESLPPGILAGWNVNPEVYANIIRHLVVEGAYGPDELTDGLVLQTLAGTNLGIRHRGDEITVNGVPVLDAAAAGNSMVYAMSQVVLPPLPAGVSPPIIDEFGVPTFTGPLLTVVGTAEPGTRIVLEVNGERHGDIVAVQDDGTWLVKEDVKSGIYDIIAYMIDDRGLLMAVSQHVELPVP